MKKKWISSVFCILCFCATLMAQDCSCPEVPNEISWKTEKEFKKSERKIRICLEWLGSHGLHECVGHRESINSYVLLWLSECPYLMVHVEPNVLPFLEDYPDLLFVVLHGMAQYQIQHPNEGDQKIIHAKGLEYLTCVLRQTKGFEGKKDFRKFQKLRRKGKLLAYVSNNWK